MKRFTIDAKIWEYPGTSATWHFITIPKNIGSVIKAAQTKKPGWGSVRVHVTIGSTAWDTSIFPDAKSGTYLLPIKAAVRRKEGLYAGDSARLTVTPLV